MTIPPTGYGERLNNLDHYYLNSINEPLYKTDMVDGITHLFDRSISPFIGINLPDTDLKYLFILTDGLFEISNGLFFARSLYYDDTQNSNGPDINVATGQPKEQLVGTNIIQHGNITVKQSLLYFGDLVISLPIFPNALYLLSGVSPSTFTETYGIIVGTGNQGYELFSSGDGRLIVDNSKSIKYKDGNPTFQNIPAIREDFRANDYLISNSGLFYNTSRQYFVHRNYESKGFDIDRNDLKTFSISGSAYLQQGLLAELYGNLTGYSFNTQEK